MNLLYLQCITNIQDNLHLKLDEMKDYMFHMQNHTYIIANIINIHTWRYLLYLNLLETGTGKSYHILQMLSQA